MSEDRPVYTSVSLDSPRVEPKLSPKQQAELRRMHDTGDYTITDLTELFSVSRPTVYRTLQRSGGS